MQALREVARVEHRDGLVRRPGREHVLVERVERQAVHLRAVRFDARDARRRVRRRFPRVPQQELLVVSHRPEDVLVLAVPRDILHHAQVADVDVLRDNLLLARAERAVHVPQADLRVVAARKQVPLAERRPRQAVPLRLVALQAQVGRARPPRGRLRGVPRVVEQVHVRGDRLRGDHEGVMRTIPSAVHLAVVIDEVRHLHLTGARAVPANLAALVILTRVNLGVLQGELREESANVKGVCMGGSQPQTARDAKDDAQSAFFLRARKHFQTETRTERRDERGGEGPARVWRGAFSLGLGTRDAGTRGRDATRERERTRRARAIGRRGASGSRSVARAGPPDVPEPPQSSGDSVRSPRCASPRSASARCSPSRGARHGRGATPR